MTIVCAIRVIRKFCIHIQSSKVLSLSESLLEENLNRFRKFPLLFEEKEYKIKKSIFKTKFSEFYFIFFRYLF